MVNKIYLLILTICLALGCVACTDDPVQAPEPVPYSPGTITLSFQNTVMSRSVDSDNSEYRIDNLVIGLYPLSADANAPATMWLTYKDLNAQNTKTFTVQLSNDMVNALFGAEDGAKCRIFALANVPEDTKVPDHASINQMKLLEVKADFKSEAKQESFVMSGGNDDVEYKKATNLSQKGHATGLVTLKRTAAKINLNIKLPDKIEVKDEDGKVKETWRPVTTNGVHVLLNNGVEKAFAVTPAPDENDNQWKPTSAEAYYNSELQEGSVRELKNTETGAYPFTMDVPFYTYPNSWTESVEEEHKTTLTLLVPWQKDGDSGSWHTLYYLVPITPSNVTFLSSNHAYTINLEVGMLGSLVPDTPIEVTDVSYQIINWGEMKVEVPIEENRYLVVNPNVYTFNNEVNMPIPYYTSHPVGIKDISIEYQRFNFVSDPKNPYVGTVVSFTIDEDKIKTTNKKNPTQPICTTSKSNTANQEYINIYHPLNLWVPHDSDGEEVSLIEHDQTYGSDSEFQDEVAATADRISYYMPIKDDAFSMYTIRFTIYHLDKPEFNESITVYQYPAIYIEAFRNPASKVSGNVFVNGYTSVSDTTGLTPPSFGSLTGIVDPTASNKNPNMYVINITSLSNNNTFTIIDDMNDYEVSTYSYIIGDPRMKDIKNLLNTNYIDKNKESLGWRNLNTTGNPAPLGPSNCKKVAGLYMEEGVTKRTLSYYYNTIEDGSVANMVAPQFRIASSWGTTLGITRPHARLRAALYQENAYPAGRWRLPTLAEFCFINKLSADDKIPLLFAKDIPYWTSEGLYSGNSDGTIHRYKGHGKRGTDQGRYSAVRAVYDEWYWKDSRYVITPDNAGNYTYTLGDVPRGVQ